MARGGVRVVAGTAGGRRLAVPAGARPTADRVREAVFSSLGEVTGTAVLDLYAGSGAAAIEALSRGADRALLVERDRDAAAVCRANLETVGFSGRARVRARAVADVLRGSLPAEAPFDLVFVDAPYDAAPEGLAADLDALTRPGWLTAGARVVLERPARGAQVPVPDGWEIGRERTYGGTLVVVLSPGDVQWPPPSAQARSIP